MEAKAAAIAFIFLLVGCSPAVISVPTEYSSPAVVTPTRINLPTLSPTFTSTVQALPTPIFTPSVWRIWFRGYSCEGIELCEDAGEGPRPKSSYFSLYSDGTELTAKDIPSLPTPRLPDGAPPLPDGFATAPQASPDKSTLVYGARENSNFGLYLVDVQTGQATKLYETKTSDDHLFWVGTACWSPDGQTIDFMLHSRSGMTNQPPLMYRINRDGSHLQALYRFPGLENAWFGNCSPDGQEIVLSLPGSPKTEENGLYLINRNTGQIKQILSGYSAVAVWPPTTEIP